MAITKKDHKFLEYIDKLEPKTKCLRAHIACVIVKNNKILVKHTNDWMPGYNCGKTGCIRDQLKIASGTRREICFGLCAEQWAISIAAQKGIKIKGATLYCTKHPCRVCASMIAAVGIIRVVYQEGYPDILPGFDILKSAKVKVEQGYNTPLKNHLSHQHPESHSI